MIEYITKLQDKHTLTSTDFENIVQKIAEKKYNDLQLSALLVLISEDSLTTNGLASFVKNILKYSKTFDSKDKMIDVCGTGGDGLKTINISTTVAFICAALGLSVAKHGNKAISSKSGSSDILTELEIPLQDDLKIQEQLLKEKKLTFFHAPFYHPLVGEVKDIRQNLGVRTVFNILGPLLHPNKELQYQLVGVYHKPVQQLYAETLQKLGRKKALVVRGNDGLDEISICDSTNIIEITQDYIKEYKITPEKYGFKRVSHDEIKGGTAKENAKTFIDTLTGKERGAKRDIVVINAMFALYTAEVVNDLTEAKKIVENALDNGTIYEYYKNYINHINMEVENGNNFRKNIS